MLSKLVNNERRKKYGCVLKRKKDNFIVAILFVKYFSKFAQIKFMNTY